MFSTQPFLRGRSSPVLVGIVCAAMVGAVGVVDYLLGYDRSILVVYFLPIGLATGACGMLLGAIISALSIGTWMVSDILAGAPAVRFWDAATGFAAYVVFSWIVFRWRNLLDDLEQRIHNRTAALRREVRERELLERELASVSERERRRLGQDLHDTLCQQLAGTALMTQALAQRLAASESPEAGDAQEIVQLIQTATTFGHDLARGLFSPELEAGGLPLALEAIAVEISMQKKAECIFDGDLHMTVRDSMLATTLYRIAREAVTNAIKHANARQIVIRLRSTDDNLILTVSDDGKGLRKRESKHQGLGMRMMEYSAAAAGGHFSIETGSQGGTTLSCTIPTADIRS